jgi:hypothetical protein
MVEWLQRWYVNQCDGDWEHENGIIIETLDNPGWSISIDLKNTGLEGIKIPYTLKEVSDEDWVGYSIEDNVFKAAGGPYKLNRIIEIFKEIFASHVKK